jgi:putative hemolysin
MKKILIIAVTTIFAVVLLIIIAGIYRFNFTNNDIYLQSGGQLGSKDETYVINDVSVTLKDGFAESLITPDSASKIITRYFGYDAIGDLNADSREDSAFILTQEGGGSGTFFYLAVSLASDQGHETINTVLLGDRIVPQSTEIKDGKLIVNFLDRTTEEAMSVEPGIRVSKDFQVLNNQVAEVNPPAQLANPASANCVEQGGVLLISKRGDGGEFGLCNFEDNRACEEWALFRGECPVGGRKTTGFDTIDQKYCAWLGGETLAVVQSVCTFKDGSECSTIDLYNGKCVAGEIIN